MTNFLDYIKNCRHHALNEALHFEDIEYDADYILAGRPPQTWKIRALRITYGGADRIIAELDKLIAKHGGQTPIMMMRVPNDDENLENLVSRIDTIDEDEYDQDNVWMSFYGDIKFNPTFLPSDQYDWSTEISLAQLKEEAKNSTDTAYDEAIDRRNEDSEEEVDEWDGDIHINFNDDNGIHIGYPVYCDEFKMVFVLAKDEGYTHQQVEKLANELFNRVFATYNNAVQQAGIEGVQLVDASNPMTLKQYACNVYHLVSKMCQDACKANHKLLVGKQIINEIKSNSMCQQLFAFVPMNVVFAIQSQILKDCLALGIDMSSMVSKNVASIEQAFPKQLKKAVEQFNIVVIDDSQPSHETYTISFPGTLTRKPLEGDDVVQHLQALGIDDVFMPSIQKFKQVFPRGTVRMKFNFESQPDEQEQQNG